MAMLVVLLHSQPVPAQTEDVVVVDGLLRMRRMVTVSLSRLSLPVRVPRKKLTDRRRWSAVTQHEVLILTLDIMSLQWYRPKSA